MGILNISNVFMLGGNPSLLHFLREHKMNESELEVALTLCYYCHKDNQIILNSRLDKETAQKVKSMDRHVINTQPCHTCEELMKERICFIEIDIDKCNEDWNKESVPNPYRTGEVMWVTNDFLTINFEGEDVLDFALTNRFMFLESPIVKTIREEAEAKGLANYQE